MLIFEKVYLNMCDILQFARRDSRPISQNLIKLLGMLCHGDLPMVGWLLDVVWWLYFSRCALQRGDFMSKEMRKVQHSYHGLPLVLSNVAFWSLKKQAPHAAAKLPKVRPCGSQTNTKAPGVCFSSDAPRADGWGLIGVFSRKFCERVGESQSAFWREWPSKPCKKLPNQQQPALRSGFRDASQLHVFTRLWRSYPW